MNNPLPFALPVNAGPSALATDRLSASHPSSQTQEINEGANPDAAGFSRHLRQAEQKAGGNAPERPGQTRDADDAGRRAQSRERERAMRHASEVASLAAMADQLANPLTASVDLSLQTHFEGNQQEVAARGAQEDAAGGAAETFASAAPAPGFNDTHTATRATVLLPRDQRHGPFQTETSSPEKPPAPGERTSLQSESLPRLSSEVAGPDRAFEPIDPDPELKSFPSAMPSHFAEAKADEAAGTAAAKFNAPMKSTVEMEKNAGLAEQNLPGLERASASPEPREPLHSVRAAWSRRDADVPTPAVSVAPPSISHGTTRPPAEELADMAPVSVLERVAEAVLDGAARLRRTGSESLSVVITPQPGTELLLRVEMRDGTLRAELQFDRGEHALLDRNWDELQRRLAEQGVRLNRSEATGFANAEHFDDSRGRRFASDENDAVELALPRFSKNTTAQTSAVSTRQSGPTRGFETWA